MTDSDLDDWGLAEFRDRTASDDPTPGGGSAAPWSVRRSAWGWC